MKCKWCSKELVVVNTQDFSKDEFKNTQKEYACTNPKCDGVQSTQKVECNCKRKASYENN